MLTIAEIEEIKKRHIELPVIEKLYADNNYPDIANQFKEIREDIDKLIENLQEYMSPRRLTMRRPPWKCCRPKCDGLIYEMKYIDEGTSKGCFYAKCPKCGNDFYT